MSTASTAGPGPALPRELAGFKNLHAGATFVVCGCGRSLRSLTHPERFTTIGVNDVGRQFTPDYLLVVNSRPQFAPGRFDAVAQSQARALFTQLDLGIAHPHIVRFALGHRGGVEFDNPHVLNYTRNSPYPALCLAIHMGARRIGLIGVDFTDGHFFADTGAHPLTPELAQIDAQYRRLNEACQRLGIEIVNLSESSRLTAFPKVAVAAFEAAALPARALRVVSYATTPVAGVPLVLSRAISHASGHEGRTVWARNGYGNGVVFDGDVEYERQGALADQLLERADVVVVHNGKVAKCHDAVLRTKPVITLAHNYMWNVDGRFVDQGYPGLVVGQYQATLPEFARWTPVPNPIALWEAAHSPDPLTARDGAVRICFVPSGTHERYPEGHRLFWHAKGYHSTMAALDALARSHGVILEVARGRQVAHRESMAMKQRSHIVIDECMTGSYHRTSLEGLAVGAVVVNGIGRLAGVAQMLKLCAGGATSMPFVAAGPDNLLGVLTALVERGPAQLTQDGQRNRRWMERHWRFEDQWQQFWIPSIERAMAAHARRSGLPQAGRAPAAVAVSAVAGVAASAVAGAAACVAGAAAAPALAPPRAGVTAVIPFAGTSRLAALGVVLASLKRQVDSVIVVECDATPFAQAISAAGGAEHVFLYSESGFHKARAVNLGAALVATELILWWDADLLAPPGFVAEAVNELTQRRLDYLVPWTSVRYLGEEASEALIGGAADGWSARPVAVGHSRQGGRGGAGLLRRDFIDCHGGMCEGFAGVGGESDAFFHKAGLFARAAATSRRTQHLLHLAHPFTRGVTSAAQMAALPHQDANRALAHEICAIGARARFLQRFPRTAAPTHRVPGIKVLCAMRIRNAAAHIAEVLASVLPLCAQVLVFDDHSDDDSVAICRHFGAAVDVMRSPFSGLDEARDKNAMLSRIAAHAPDWVLWIDGDEVLERGAAGQLGALLGAPDAAPILSLQIAYLWDTPCQVRIDGIFGRFQRPSLFQYRGQPTHKFLFSGQGPSHLHCGNVPRGVIGRHACAGVRLKHHGYISAAQRQRQFDWYNSVDPDNLVEDGYRHLIGVPGARHAPGPTVLVAWNEPAGCGSRP